tara:strand:- start:29 stop:301 length:273 start_codon:yes stop_codon:yes gene_type:complete
MKRCKNNVLILLAGFLFVTSISADPLIHDHFHESDKLISCDYFENKTIDVPNLISVQLQRFFSVKISIEPGKSLALSFLRIFNSRAPPKI